MSNGDNTLFLRLAGPTQSWGTSSRFQLRRTDAHPSKSGVLGLLLCAKGVRREDSTTELHALNSLLMGVRIDRSGTSGWDFHTTGAKIGIRQAKDGKPKRTESTHELEVSVSRRQYLYDASFLVVLQGDEDQIHRCASALQDPAWPPFLGRRCCVPAEPIFAGTGRFQTAIEALSSVPWRRRDGDGPGETRTFTCYLEHPAGSPAPPHARLVHDTPVRFGFWSHAPRYVVMHHVSATVDEATQRPNRPHRAPAPDREALRHRMDTDHHLCVFCKSPAEEVHHISYANFGHETDDDLRSLCAICHLACTSLEYGHDMKSRRIDPSDPAQRATILRQVERLLKEGPTLRRRALLNAARAERAHPPGAALPEASCEGE